MKTYFLAAILALTAQVADAASWVDKRTSPAKGTKTCTISQISQSKYLEEHGYSNSLSLPKVLVAKNGTISMGLREDKYPGSKVYFLLGKHRYVGNAGFYVPINSAGLQALKNGEVIQFTFTNWPYRGEINGADVLEDFDTAYQECVSFLR
jgi:hypothetical protein